MTKNPQRLRDPHDELLCWHYPLGHLPFDCIKQLASAGQLPKRLLACKKPFCSACQYGKMTKRPREVKGENKETTKTATRPGQIVLVDQLESNTPGLIAQLKGNLTQQWYKYATVFVDQFSGYTFVYLQKRLTSVETVMTKHAFEHSADQRGVKISHCHADNGRFADNSFITDCKAQRQGLSYCGVNAHFQNGIAERRIRDLQEQTRKSMIYAMNKWKCMILICLWPYAMRHANDGANATPRKREDQSRLELFSGVKITPKLRHFHAFGCPTYVLDNALQSGQGTEMETMLKTGCIPRTITESRSIGGLSSQSTHRPCLTPISRQIRRFFRLFRIYPLIWTHLSRTGNTSVVLQSRKVARNLWAEEQPTI